MAVACHILEVGTCAIQSKKKTIFVKIVLKVVLMERTIKQIVLGGISETKLSPPVWTLSKQANFSNHMIVTTS